MVLSRACLLEAENTCRAEGRQSGRLGIVSNDGLGVWMVNSVDLEAAQASLPGAEYRHDL